MLSPGQVYHATLTMKNQTGPPSTAALAIGKPDGTTVSPAPVLAPGTQVGADWVITYDYTLPTPGLFKFTWTTQGPGTAPTPVYENVRDYVSIIGMGEIKAHLNITSVDAARDDELSGYLMASTELVENKVGICVPRQLTWRVEPGSRFLLATPFRPLISAQSVTSIWAGGPSWGAAVLAVDAEAGIVYQPTGMDFWWGPWDVAVTAGRQIMPERFIHAAKEQVRHLWDTQRGSQPPSLLMGEETYTATTGFTFSVPRRVLELLEQDMVPSI